MTVTLWSLPSRFVTVDARALGTHNRAVVAVTATTVAVLTAALLLISGEIDYLFFFFAGFLAAAFLAGFFLAFMVIRPSIVTPSR
jgi:hypothetical protein